MKVLLVDDEDDIRKIAELSLRAVGKFETCVASGGREGIEVARAEAPDLILMDMMMPEIDGLGTLAELRQDPELAEIPVIFMTAKVQKSEVELYLSKGAIGVIKKPFDPMLLSEEVRRLFAEAQG
tara:strand:- start:779 stop:1153 length:375 start_codon:yes stop_codon:yes gene_type:complete